MAVEAVVQELRENHEAIVATTDRLSAIGDQIRRLPLHQELRLAVQNELQNVKEALLESAKENDRLIGVLTTLNTGLQRQVDSKEVTIGQLTANGGMLIRAFSALVILPPAVAVLVWLSGWLS